MPRPRTNDPSNLPEVVNLTTSPARQAELAAEMQKRFQYLMTSYSLSRKGFADNLSFNRSLDRLKRGVARQRKSRRKQERLHPEIEMVISYHARRLAGEEGIEVEGAHIREAACLVAKILKPRRGRPDDRMLELHVQGLIALIQESCGKPVIASRSRNSIYDPHFSEGISSLVPMFFEAPDQGITINRLVDIVRKTRSAYAGKPLCFLDLFPGYGAKADEQGALTLRPGLRLEHFEPNIPIYCP